MDDETSKPDPLARVLRRRDLAGSLHIPVELTYQFTREGGMAVLKVIADEHVQHGACTLTLDAIADLSSTNRTTVKIAIRAAKAEGLIKIKRGRRYNTITIISAKWKAWLDR
jgi:hypothetical protein